MDEQTAKGMPWPRPGELWELQYPGFPRFRVRVERVVGATAVVMIVWADTAHPRYRSGSWEHRPFNLAPQGEWESYHPQKVEE